MRSCRDQLEDAEDLNKNLVMSENIKMGEIETLKNQLREKDGKLKVVERELNGTKELKSGMGNATEVKELKEELNSLKAEMKEVDVAHRRELEDKEKLRSKLEAEKRENAKLRSELEDAKETARKADLVNKVEFKINEELRAIISEKDKEVNKLREENENALKYRHKWKQRCKDATATNAEADKLVVVER